MTKTLSMPAMAFFEKPEDVMISRFRVWEKIEIGDEFHHFKNVKAVGYSFDERVYGIQTDRGVEFLIGSRIIPHSQLSNIRSNKISFTCPARVAVDLGVTPGVVTLEYNDFESERKCYLYTEDRSDPQVQFFDSSFCFDFADSIGVALRKYVNSH